jgi:hemolysin activation/secretion protein
LQLAVRRTSEGFAVRRDVSGDVSVEGGRRDGGAAYLRLAAAGQVLLPVGETRLLFRAQGGFAGSDLPPHRAFVLGGRGTLLGDPFRSWGGARMLLGHVEWRVPVAVAALRFAGARVPATITLAPFAAAGWTGGPVAGTPWPATPDLRITVGAALEWLGAFRLDAGYGVQSRRVHLAFDVTRDLWGIL